jgi:NitT/TauT family transport system substrate-binding protein
MVKKHWHWFSFVLIAALVLTGCVSANTEKRPPLRVEWTDWEGDYTLLIAQEKGFFAKYGVEVEPVYYATYSKAIPDLASSYLDAGLFSIQDMLAANSVTKVKTVAVYDSGGTVAVVARSEIASVADLKGKKVAAVLGSYGDMFIREMLSSAGMTLNDIELVNLDPSQVPAALTNESISAGYVWAPLDQQALKEGHKILYTQTAALLSPDVIVFHADVVEQRPDDVRAFITAWFEAAEFRQSNPQESQKIIASITGKPLSEIAPNPDLKLYNRAENQQFFSQDAARDDTIYALAKQSLDFKILRGDLTFLPDLNVILDPSFLQTPAVSQAQ